MSKKPRLPQQARYRALIVAAEEAAAQQLVAACTGYERLLLLGMCSPDGLPDLLQSTGADLIVALLGTRLPVVTAPVVYVTQDKPVQELEWQLGVSPGASPAADAGAPEPPAAPPPAAVSAGPPPPVAALPAPRHASPSPAPPGPAVAEPGVAAPSAVGAAPSAPPRNVRVGFYGTRGGLGVTTTAVTVARWLAGQGARVAVCDVPRRGDVALLLGGEPGEEVQTLQEIAVYPGLLPEAALDNYDAVVLDSGRQRATFAARWVELDNPVTDARVGRILRDLA